MAEGVLRLIKLVVTAGGWAWIGAAFLVTACSSSYPSASGKRLSPAATAGVSPKTNPLPDRSTVTVIPNPYEDDLYQANLAVEATKEVLQARGYNVVPNETTAGLVAIPTLETNRVKIIQTSPPPSDVFSQFDQPSRLLGSSPSLPNLRIKQTTTIGTKANEPTLVIEAFRSDVWNKALLVNMLQLPPVWKVVTSLPAQYSTNPLDLQRTGGPNTQFELPPNRLLTNATNR